jgi:hypothetical protein
MTLSLNLGLFYSKSAGGGIKESTQILKIINLNYYFIAFYTIVGIISVKYGQDSYKQGLLFI